LTSASSASKRTDEPAKRTSLSQLENLLGGETIESCPKCGARLPDEAMFCSSCGFSIGSVTPGGRPGFPSAPRAASPVWFQNFYRIRKKIVAIANQYWIENQEGQPLGYTRQKIISLKDEIRIFSDESMSSELFRVKQEQIVDTWGIWDVIDSMTGVCVGKLKRQIKSSVTSDEYLILDAAGQQLGRIVESSGRGLARRYMPGGGLVPEHVVVEFYGKEVAEIKQRFKVIGDVWEVDCSRLPPQFDRRTLLAGMVIMGALREESR
jgi:uncharacterized protein YxjI